MLLENNLPYELIKLQWDSIHNKRPFPENPHLLKSTLATWKCEKGHFWYETIENRAFYQKCHMCQASKRLTEVYNLQYLRPDIAAQLHPTKNRMITADKLRPFSSKVVTWFCDKGHEWEVKVWARTTGQGCPECSNRKVSKDNNLAVLYPHFIEEWDDEENGDLTPSDVVPGSRKKVGWKCNKDHRWPARIVDRAIRGRGCPECKNRKVGKDNNLAVLYPDIAKQLHPTLNGTLTAYDLLPGSSKRVWWFCEKNHEWEAEIASRIKGRNCAKCYRLKMNENKKKRKFNLST